MNEQAVVDKIAAVWQSITELCTPLTEAEWKTATDCPGWSVQDQVSHLVGAERRFMGYPSPDHTPADLSHVKNESGERNEALVDFRRSWPGAKVLDEFKEVTTERLQMLRNASAEDFAAETQTPLGPGTLLSLIEIRAFDAWIHEQDMRRALNRPGHLEGIAAEHSVGRCASAMPFVVGRKAQAPDGSTVVFDLTGPAGRTLTVHVDGKRANVVDAPPASPTVKLTMDVETFACLGCGRWDADTTLQANKVGIEGNRTLGETIIRQINFMI